MSDTPFEPSRRSRREARAEVDTAPSEPSLSVGHDDRGASDRPADRPRASNDRPARRPASGFFGTWKPLAAAAAALVVAIVVGLLAGVAFNGAAGRSVGSVLASVVVGGTGLGLMARTRPAGFFSLRGLDVLWALVLGAILPFVTGIAAGSLGWPAFAALSPRWLLLGVVAPFVVTVMLAFFAIGFVFPAALSYASTRFTPTIARVVGGVVSALAFAIIPLVFSGTVSGMPTALFVGLGIAASVFVGLSLRFWGPLLLSLVFPMVWVALSVAGYLLA